MSSTQPTIVKIKERIKTRDMATNAKYPQYGPEDLCVDDWDQYRCVSSKEKDFDSEKGFVDYEVVLRRRSDGKFFMFTYTQFGHNGNDAAEQVAVEVEEKTRIETYYE